MSMPDPPVALNWTPWQPLRGAWLGMKLPSEAGLYRIRRIGFDGIDYIGQTGKGTMTLKKRMGMLTGVYKDVMPYRDPHTVGPALWALRDRDGVEFEVSVAVVEGSTPWRKGLEALAIALYRRERGASPTVNFGRMPAGYRMSSANNAKLVSTGRRFRGGPTSSREQSHVAGVAPAGGLEGSPCGPLWCGHRWSAWTPLPGLLPPSTGVGLYRIRYSGSEALLYVGEGKARGRLRAHLAKIERQGHPQGELLGRSPLEASWVLEGGWLGHQRLELENDLIGAHVHLTGAVPEAQFLG